MVCHQGEEPEVNGFGGQICRLALGSRGGLETFPCFEEVSGKIFLGERLVVDLDALANETEVGRCVKPYLMEQRSRFRGGGVPVLSQYGRDESTCRTLALGARNVYEVQPIEIRWLPISQPGCACRSRLKSESSHLVSNPSTPLDHFRYSIFVQAPARLPDGIHDGEITLQCIEGSNGVL